MVKRTKYELVLSSLDPKDGKDWEVYISMSKMRPRYNSWSTEETHRYTIRNEQKKRLIIKFLASNNTITFDVDRLFKYQFPLTRYGYQFMVNLGYLKTTEEIRALYLKHYNRYYLVDVMENYPEGYTELRRDVFRECKRLAKPHIIANILENKVLVG